MKYLLIITLIIIISVSLFADDKELSNSLGFAGGIISGSGFAFKHDFGKTAYQVVFGIISNNNDVWGNAGFQYFYNLRKAKRSTFYTFSGLSTYSQTGHNPTIHTGIGLGISYKSKNMRLALESPLALSFKEGEKTNVSMFIPQASLTYFF